MQKIEECGCDPEILFDFLGKYTHRFTEEEMDDSHNPDIKEGINPWGTAATVVLSLLVFGILFLFWFLNQLGEAFS